MFFPEGGEVNDFIETFCQVKYASLEIVLGMISALGKGAELGKIYIQQAFRLLIVNPADFDLLGIKFEGRYWITKNLPMSCAISCNLFTLARAVQIWVGYTRSLFG